MHDDNKFLDDIEQEIRSPIHLGGQHTVLQSTYYRYEPLVDITVYELALILPVAVSLNSMYTNTVKLIEKLPDHARRHFKKYDPYAAKE